MPSWGLPSFLIFCLSFNAFAFQKTNYTDYHKAVLVVEEYITTEDYKQALSEIETIISSYDFVFLKEYKIAAQLALKVEDKPKAFQLLEKSIAAGWSLKQIKKERFLKPLTTSNHWASLVKKNLAMNQSYENKLNLDLQEVTKAMYKKDQKMAWKYLFRIGQKAKERFANKKVKPHALEQMKKLDSIIKVQGYPGEKLIGEPEWMSTILSHHNSVSDNFVKNDTLFDAMRPQLLKAITKGELNPYEFAMIEDWRIAITSDRQKTGYGYLEYLKPEEINTSDTLRKQLGIRSVGLRNQLVDIQEKTGMNFYLAGSGWVDGKIGL